MPLVYFLLKALGDPPATAKNELASRSECLDLKFDLGFEFRSPENIYFGIQYVCLFSIIRNLSLFLFSWSLVQTDFAGIISIYKKQKYSITIRPRKNLKPVLESAGQ